MKVNVALLDREYTVNCPSGAEDRLRACVTDLEAICQQIRQKNPTASVDKVLAIAAINLASQCVQMEKELLSVSGQIEVLKSKLELIE